MGTLDRLGGPCRQLRPLGREQVLQHRLPGQRVAETEGGALGAVLGGDDLGVDRRSQGRQDGSPIQARRVGDQGPVEAPPQHRGRPQDHPVLLAEAPQALAHHPLERLGDLWSALGPQLPDAALPHQRAARDAGGQDLLDQERHPLGPGRQQTPQAVGEGWRVECRPGHGVHVRIREALELQDRRVAPRDQQSGQHGSWWRLVGAHRDQAEEALRGEVVGQVLDQGQRLRVGPVKVFQRHQGTGGSGQHAQQAERSLVEQQAPVGNRLLPLRPLRDEGTEHRPVRRQLGRVGRPGRAGGAEQRLGERAERDRRARRRPRPRRTCIPADRAAASSWSVSRDFPTPASPRITTRPPRPARASPSAAWRRPSSSWRPPRPGTGSAACREYRWLVPPVHGVPRAVANGR